MTYAVAEPEVKYRLASTADSKTEVVIDLVAKHRGVPTLVIGQYVDQLEDLAAQLDAPLITGETTVRQRERLYEAFRSGEIDLLVVSKVANFSVDLPSAQVAIQVSGAFGSRQEEAQRLGRLLRPKSDGVTARFYAVVVPGHRRRRLRRPPAALPGRAGLRLPHHGRRRRPRRRLVSRAPRFARTSGTATPAASVRGQRAGGRRGTAAGVSREPAPPYRGCAARWRRQVREAQALGRPPAREQCRPAGPTACPLDLGRPWFHPTSPAAVADDGAGGTRAAAPGRAPAEVAGPAARRSSVRRRGRSTPPGCPGRSARHRAHPASDQSSTSSCGQIHSSVCRRSSWDHQRCCNKVSRSSAVCGGDVHLERRHHGQVERLVLLDHLVGVAVHDVPDGDRAEQIGLGQSRSRSPRSTSRIAACSWTPPRRPHRPGSPTSASPGSRGRCPGTAASVMVDQDHPNRLPGRSAAGRPGRPRAVRPLCLL